MSHVDSTQGSVFTNPRIVVPVGGVVLALLLYIGLSSLWDVAAKYAALSEASDLRTRLERSEVRSTKDGVAPGRRATSFVAKTVSTAAASLLQRVSLVVSEAGGAITASSMGSAEEAPDRLRLNAQFKVAESKLVEVLGRLEEDDPTVLVEALSILGRAQGGAEETQLDINIELSALWRPE